MELLDAIRQRHSVRAYTDQLIEEEKVQKLQQMINEINTKNAMHIQLVLNEPTAFDCKLARYGSFSNVRNYLVLAGKQGDDLEEKAGYYGEMLVLEAQCLGLNTCWVGLTYKKNPEAYTLANDEKLVMVIAIGYGVTQGRAHHSKSLDAVNRHKGKAPDWYYNGIGAALLAPTAVNQQKFSFQLNGNRVQLKMGVGFYTEVDKGILKYHFEAGAGKEYFTWSS